MHDIYNFDKKEKIYEIWINTFYSEIKQNKYEMPYNLWSKFSVKRDPWYYSYIQYIDKWFLVET